MALPQRDTDYKLSSSMKFSTLLKQGKTQCEAWELMEAEIRTVFMEAGLSWMADVFFACATQIQESNGPTLPAPASAPALAPPASPSTGAQPLAPGSSAWEQHLRARNLAS
eukprot:3735306-Rhodomonas_salina.1